MGHVTTEQSIFYNNVNRGQPLRFPFYYSLVECLQIITTLCRAGFVIVTVNMDNNLTVYTWI